MSFPALDWQDEFVSSLNFIVAIFRTFVNGDVHETKNIIPYVGLAGLAGLAGLGGLKPMRSAKAVRSNSSRLDKSAIVSCNGGEKML